MKRLTNVFRGVKVIFVDEGDLTCMFVFYIRILKKQRGYNFTMNNLTKKFTFATTALLATGILAFNQADEVSAAAEWEARTVEHVTQDVQKNEDGSKVYTVQSGDTLAVIAQAFEVEVGLLASANNISNPNLIHTGTEITLSADQKVVTTKDPAGNTQTSQTQAPAQEQAQAPVETSNTQAYSAPQKNVSSSSQAQYSSPQPKQQAAASQSSNSGYTSNATGGEAAAKEWIAQRESNGSYTAVNGQYWGRYQLNPTLVSHGAGPAEQEAAADKYVSGRYGSWSSAKSHWEQKGWY